MNKTALLLLVLLFTNFRFAIGAQSKSKSRTHRSAKASSAVQAQPTPDRYRQIQQALADKGYFKGEVNGHWAADSIDALKRFQADQKLTPDGKVNALSLIAMGLGPKRLSAQAAPAQPETQSEARQ